jgi:hypothetical protein
MTILTLGGEAKESVSKKDILAGQNRKLKNKDFGKSFLLYFLVYSNLQYSHLFATQWENKILKNFFYNISLVIVVPVSLAIKDRQCLLDMLHANNKTLVYFDTLGSRYRVGPDNETPFRNSKY